MKRRVLSVLLIAVGVLSVFFVPVLLLYNGWPVDIPLYLHTQGNIAMRPYLSADELVAIRDLLIFTVPVGAACLYAGFRLLHPSKRRSNNAR